MSVSSEESLVIGKVDVIIDGKNTETYDVPVDELLLVGNDSDTCEICVKEPGILRQHLEIFVIGKENWAGLDEHLVYARNLSGSGCWWNGVSFMSKDRGTFLLSDGDTIKINRHVKLAICLDKDMLKDCKVDSRPWHEVHGKLFMDQYKITDIVTGSNPPAEAEYMALNTFNMKQNNCRIIDLLEVHQAAHTKHIGLKRKRSADDEEDSDEMSRQQDERAAKKAKKAVNDEIARVERFAEATMNINHPNVIRVESAWKYRDAIFIFEELLTGGTLAYYLEQWEDGCVDEEIVGTILRQLLEAVKVVHSKDMVLNGISLTNVMLENVRDYARAVLTGFEAIKDRWNFNPRDKSFEQAQAQDVGSIGCIGLELLCGHSRPSMQVLAKLAEKDARKALLDLISHLLIGGRRDITAAQALQHDFFTHGASQAHFDAVYKTQTRTWQPLPPKESDKRGLVTTYVATAEEKRELKLRGECLKRSTCSRRRSRTDLISKSPRHLSVDGDSDGEDGAEAERLWHEDLLEYWDYQLPKVESHYQPYYPVIRRLDGWSPTRGFLNRAGRNEIYRKVINGTAADEDDWYGRQLREEQTSEASTVVGESDSERGSNDDTAYSDDSDAQPDKVVEDGHNAGAKTECVRAEKASTEPSDLEAQAIENGDGQTDEEAIGDGEAENGKGMNEASKEAIGEEETEEEISEEEVAEEETGDKENGEKKGSDNEFGDYASLFAGLFDSQT